MFSALLLSSFVCAASVFDLAHRESASASNALPKEKVIGHGDFSAT